jgi:ABC-type nickel/cobalt efflux system permease component RcnA
MYEVIFVFVVIFTAVYLCLRKRRRLLEAQLQVGIQTAPEDIFSTAGHRHTPHACSMCKQACQPC